MSFKRRVLSALQKDELLEIGRSLELEVRASMRIEELRDTIAQSRRASVPAIVQESLSRDALKAICLACGLDDSGKEKRPLVERIVAAADGGSGTYKIDRAATKGSIAREGSVRGFMLPGFDIPAKPPTKAKGRRRADTPDSEAVVSGSLKSALREFAIEAAGGFRGRDSALTFTTRLLRSFGWSDGRPEGAEIPRLFSVAENGHRVEREVALWWPERRTMMEVAPQDTVLDYAWKDLMRVCLQLDPMPQYVVLTNQRDLQLYDLAGNRDAWRLSIPIDDLPKQSDAFPFFMTDWRPGVTPRIINSDKVSKEVAELVAKVYRSVLAQYPKREDDVIRFTLQCITAMFAEDIGLLPRNHFTSLLYVGAQQRDVETRLRELFVQMNTRNLSHRAVPYFNGGLFTKIETLPLGSEQLMALTEAAQANWTHVDPHIFGSVFQNIMDAEERHASGAHYTAHDDIMRVVGPTIVEPWRKRIQAATSLKELTELRTELFRFKVLDPACGSGNFLYIAFRELYALDTELLTRMLRDFPSTHGKLSWSSAIPATNFYGFDINRFAVELAKVTLNIAKKKAFEERKEKALTFHGQVEMDTDPSLPLDNLDNNIVEKDALFTDWPEANAIVGNPPFLGGLKIRSELGEDYLEKLQKRYPGVNGRADFCSFWFRRAHDHLKPDQRAGLVATNTIREGNTREAATDYIVQNGGTITNAVSSQPWPGLAVVNVSMLNWVKGPAEGEPKRLVIDGVNYDLKVISPSLQLAVDLGSAVPITTQALRCTVGIQHGTKAFEVDASMAAELRRDKRARPFVKPVASASELLRGRISTEPDYVIDLSRCETEEEARKTGAAYEHLRKHVYPFVLDRAKNATTAHYKTWLRSWWRPMWPRADFFANAANLNRILVCSAHAARCIFVFLSRNFFPTNSLQVFAYADDYSFGILQSSFHWRWALGVGTKIKEDIRYSGDVWETFPWPQEPPEANVVAVAAAGRALREVRDKLMRENGWSLRDLYQSADVPRSHPLNDAQAALDHAVGEAYGIPPDQDVPEFLLDLNHALKDDEQAGREFTGPGLPKQFASNDRRWMSTDCIEPAPTKN
jgi:hypothetical protein